MESEKNQLEELVVNPKKILFSKIKKYDENPFIEKAIQDVKIVKKTQFMNAKEKGEIQMIVSEGGEVVGHSAFLKFVEVDEAQFAKVYLSQFQAFWDLKSSSIRVFGYIISILKPKQDSFIIYMDKALQHTKYKNAKDINAGLLGLINAGIIAKSKYEFHYFINPLVVFNGDRVSFTKTYIKKKTTANPNQLNLLDAIGEQKRLNGDL